jgi:hypothetical protein
LVRFPLNGFSPTWDLRGVIRVVLEPQGISAPVDFTGPFQAATAIAHTYFREERRIAKEAKTPLPMKWPKQLTVVSPFARVIVTV